MTKFKEGDRVQCKNYQGCGGVGTVLGWDHDTKHYIVQFDAVGTQWNLSIHRKLKIAASKFNKSGVGWNVPSTHMRLFARSLEQQMKDLLLHDIPTDSDFKNQVAASQRQ